MEPIALQRLRVLLPFTQFLAKIGVPIEHALERARMPLDLDGQKDAYVPIRLQVQFLHEMIVCGGVDDLGLRVAHRVGVGFVSDALRAELMTALTLHQGLHVLCGHIHRESSLTRIWIVAKPGQGESGDYPKDRSKSDIKSDTKSASNTGTDSNSPAATDLGTTRVYHHGPISVGTPVHRHMDWARTMLIIAVVRLFVGQHWTPTQIQLAGDGPPGDTAAALFPNTLLTVSDGPGFVELPTALLSLPIASAPSTRYADDQPTWPSSPGIDFSGSLIQLMQTYLPAGYPNVDLAAELAGTSARSLQRRLREQGTSYRQVIQRARFELACHLLRDPGLRVLDIAYALGFDDPSNFARSFRQIAGVGPEQYRQELLVQDAKTRPGTQVGRDNSA